MVGSNAHGAYRGGHIVQSPARNNGHDLMNKLLVHLDLRQATVKGRATVDGAVTRLIAYVVQRAHPLPTCNVLLFAGLEELHHVGRVSRPVIK